MTTPTLVEFLNARLDEDEQAAAFAGGGAWTVEADNHLALPMVKMPRLGPLARFGSTTHYEVTGSDDSQTFHIGRHHPARVLAEVKAKRKLLMELEERSKTAIGGGVWYDLLTYMSWPYADHPDWREEWRA